MAKVSTAERQLAEAIAETPPPPCDGCPRARRCAAKTEGCSAWSQYVADGEFKSEFIGHMVHSLGSEE